MSGKLLMFECNSLAMAIAVDRAMAGLDVEVVPVARKNYNKPLEDLADAWSEVYNENADLEPYTGGALGGQMMILCELDDKIEQVLTALRSAGVGIDCLKAVLTKHNKSWDAVKLYGELQKESLAMRGK